MRLQNKVAVVTGAGGGFGEGIARIFAEHGAKVVVTDLDAEAPARVAGESGGFAVAGDVSRAADVRAMVDAATAQYGGLDILVNNAGTTHRNQPMLDVDEATFDRVYAVNVKSLYLTAQAAVPVLRRQKPGRQHHHQHQHQQQHRRHSPAPGAGMVQWHEGRSEHDDAMHGDRAGAG
ncbi:MAG TPA: SDR family NAD(P)-dependent oxidoreductase [Acetobacteraceae bacterium]|jgi:3-oxoacyl-[acyl-carrier protein] reductase